MPRFIIVLRVWKLASKYYLPPKKGRKKERNAGSPNNCMTRRPKLSAIHVTANLTGQPLIVWCWFQGRTNVHPVSLYPRVYNLINRIAYFALAAISRFSIFCSITSFKIIFTGTYSNLANLWCSLPTKSIVVDGLCMDRRPGPFCIFAPCRSIAGGNCICFRPVTKRFLVQLVHAVKVQRHCGEVGFDFWLLIVKYES